MLARYHRGVLPTPSRRFCLNSRPALLDIAFRYNLTSWTNLLRLICMCVGKNIPFINSRFFTTAVILFLLFTASGVSVTLHYCHGMGGKFSISSCSMSQIKSRSDNFSKVISTSRDPCCANHTFSLTSSDRYNPFLPKIYDERTWKNLRLVSSSLADYFCFPLIIHPLKFPSRSTALHTALGTYLLNSALLI